MTPDDFERIKSRIPLRLSDSADADELVREVERLGKIIVGCDTQRIEALALLAHLRELHDAALIQVESTRKQSAANYDNLVRAEGERDAALAHVAGLRGALLKIQELVKELDGKGPCWGCDTFRGIVTPALALTPADALALQQARRAVVEAAIAYHQVEVLQKDVEGGSEFVNDLWGAVTNLKRLEAPPCQP